MNFKFENLEIYQKSLDFIEIIFTKTNKWPTIYLFNPTDQLKRAALSTALNIAEGSSRTRIEFKRFLSIARGSCFECIPLIEIAFREKLISTKTKEEWYNHCVSLAKMLSKLKSSL
ncbi:hypothetical protein A2Z22_03950 [Candidatus Woesebacteria bacterium RBG_16_34_12]|uniref:Four helix bundle protein n=1 Tax=Candidatus Woesebacteria bacterium RBG_16_34_12 TaxID=1802480 RepID=A0A1F7X7D1_9BACT|nr:MAG: hypothetical protein A2Z22_03950 [Candidatus Woesebacteria bacterium RBG_16_34_12]